MSLLPPYANRELFSQHFLDRRLPAEPAWAEARAGAAPLLAALRALLAKERDKLPAYNEEQLRHHWIDPVLSILGTAWDPEPSLATDTGASEHPDYLLFADDAARDAARRQLDEGRVDAYGRAAAFVGEAKAWGTSFTAASSGQRTPRQQLTDYIHLSGLPWGFLTDGARWRLTHSSVAGRLDRFYEVNLVECLDSPNDEHVLWFLLFFSPAAYRPDADGHTLLDRIREGSLAYAHEVGEGLNDSVYEALELLARGFLRRGPQPLDVLHEECLTLLYRLLFLLYAEDRELLPVGDASYQPYSLRTLGAEIAARRDRGESWSRGGKLLWCHLRSLFDVVDRGDEDLGIPPYNGGLFDAGRHPLLAALEGPGTRRSRAPSTCWRARAPSSPSASTTATSTSGTWAPSTRGCWSTTCAAPRRTGASGRSAAAERRSSTCSRARTSRRASSFERARSTAPRGPTSGTSRARSTRRTTSSSTRCAMPWSR